MTDQEWFQATDPYELLEALFPLRGFDSTEPQPRPSRLYYIACGRRAWHRLPPLCQVLVQLAERLYHPRQPDLSLRDAVYPLAEEMLHAAGRAERLNALAARLVAQGLARPDELFVSGDVPYEQWEPLAQLTFGPFNPWTPPYRRILPEYHSVELLRDVFAPPSLRRYRFPPGWLTATVHHLALQAYHSGEPILFFVLADALEDAGCFHPQILNHLRGNHPHVRGCWVVEMIFDQLDRLESHR